MTHNRRKYLWRTLSRLEGSNCFYCRRDLVIYSFTDRRNLPDRMTIDHLWPQSKGGAHELGNCVLACPYCNSTKSNKTFDEMIGRVSFGLA